VPFVIFVVRKNTESKIGDPKSKFKVGTFYPLGSTLIIELGYLLSTISCMGARYIFN
jgi:hypothetical protein